MINIDNRFSSWLLRAVVCRKVLSFAITPTVSAPNLFNYGFESTVVLKYLNPTPKQKYKNTKPD